MSLSSDLAALESKVKLAEVIVLQAVPVVEKAYADLKAVASDPTVTVVIGDLAALIALFKAVA